MSERRKTEEMKKSLGREISDMLGFGSSLPDQEWVTAPWYNLKRFEGFRNSKWRTYQRVLESINEKSKRLLSSSKTKEETTRVNRIKEELADYAELTFSAIESYTLAAYGRAVISPLATKPFSEKECDKLIDYIWKYDVPRPNWSDGFGLENIREIREKLSMPVSSKLKELIMKRKQEIEVRNVLGKFRILREEFQEPEKNYCLNDLVRGLSAMISKKVVLEKPLPDVSCDSSERSDLQDKNWTERLIFLQTIDDTFKRKTSQMKRDLSNFIGLEQDLRNISATEQDVELCLKKITEIKRELSKAEKMKEELKLYTDLLSRALDEDLCNGANDLFLKSNPLTEDEVNKLVGFAQRYGSISLAPSEKGVNNKRGLQERLDEIHRKKREGSREGDQEGNKVKLYNCAHLK